MSISAKFNDIKTSTPFSFNGTINITWNGEVESISVTRNENGIIFIGKRFTYDSTTPYRDISQAELTVLADYLVQLFGTSTAEKFIRQIRPHNQRIAVLGKDLYLFHNGIKWNELSILRDVDTGTGIIFQDTDQFNEEMNEYLESQSINIWTKADDFYCSDR